MIPKGWRVGKIGELFSFVIGGDWGKDEFSAEYSVNCAVIRGTDIDDIWTGKILRVPYRFVKPSSFQKREIKEGDIIIEMAGGSKDQATGRNLLILHEILDLFQSPVIPTSFCRLIRAKDLATSVFIGTFLRIFYAEGGTWDYQLQSTGISNFQFVDFANRLLIVIPPDEILQKFVEIIVPFYREIGTMNILSTSLTQMRDARLPRLMNGEIGV